MNPYGGREVGWEQVRAAWERAAQDYSGSQTTITLRVLFEKEKEDEHCIVGCPGFAGPGVSDVR